MIEFALAVPINCTQTQRLRDFWARVSTAPAVCAGRQSIPVPFGIEAETYRFTISGEARWPVVARLFVATVSPHEIEHAHFGAVLLTDLFRAGAT